MVELKIGSRFYYKDKLCEVVEGGCNLNECVFKGTNKCSKVKCFDYQGIDRIDVIFKEVKNDKD